MLRPRRILGFAMFLASTVLLPVHDITAQAAPKISVPTVSSTQRAKHRSKKIAPVAEVPQAAPVPPTLEQQPPAAPQVTYTNGQLSITSTNATLSQILRSVQTQTGASIDIPAGAGNERVVATLGPGKPQAVLASLLNGSKFNYVILGAPNDSGAVQKVILLAKSTTTTGQAPDTVAQNNYRAPQPQQAIEPPDDEYQQPEPEVENQNPGQLTPGQPGMPGAENLNPDAINPAGRTPEQMLQELQRMQQQQQQLQQQLNPANQQQPQGAAFPNQAPPPQPQ